MDGGERERHDGRKQGQPIQPVPEDRVHMPIGAGAPGQGAGTGRFEALGPSAAAQAQEAQTDFL